MSSLTLSPAVYEILKQTTAAWPPESGAVIGAHNISPHHITKVWPDQKAGSGKEYYIPSIPEINDQVRQWIENDAHFAGIVHSHHVGFPDPSAVDIRSAHQILRSCRMKYLYLGLFHRGELSMFKILEEEYRADPQVEKVEYRITLPDEYRTGIRPFPDENRITPNKNRR